MFDRKKINRTPVALALAVALLGLGGAAVATAMTAGPMPQEDMVIRVNPTTNLTPDDPGAMPTGATTEDTTPDPQPPAPVETATDTPTPALPTTTIVVVEPEPQPVETEPVTAPPARNPVYSTDTADPVDLLPAEPVIEETTFNPVRPTTDAPAPPAP